jgi:hypothetical protein
MKKYRLLRFGHCYINRNGDFAIALLGGNKTRGYIFQASHTCRNFMPGKITIRSRVVPNDGYWVEIPPQEFVVCNYLHGEGRAVKLEKV